MQYRKSPCGCLATTPKKRPARMIHPGGRNLCGVRYRGSPVGLLSEAQPLDTVGHGSPPLQKGQLQPSPGIGASHRARTDPSRRNVPAPQRLTGHSARGEGYVDPLGHPSALPPSPAFIWRWRRASGRHFNYRPPFRKCKKKMSSAPRNTWAATAAGYAKQNDIVAKEEGTTITACGVIH